MLLSIKSLCAAKLKKYFKTGNSKRGELRKKSED